MANNDLESVPLIKDQCQHSEDNLSVEIDIPTDDEDLEPGPECCIYKVPSCMRKANQEAYTPQLISIGPLHNGNPNLARMERQKLRYYKIFSKKTGKEAIEECSSYIKNNMKGICRCYDAEFVFNTESDRSKFIKMILYDSVFIIELLLKNSEDEDSDFLFTKDWVKLQLKVDLFLLENQLPFFVLEDLYNVAFPSTASDSDRPSFFFLACSFFQVNQHHLPIRPRHFTDLVRSEFVRVHPPRSNECINQVYSATMLREAGVKFKATGNCGLDLKFDKDEGVLHIPRFFIKSITDALFRNLMAFEQCHDPENAYFCSYIQLLDFLVDDSKDVDILVKEGIIMNQIGSSQAVGDMINALMEGVEGLTTCYCEMGKNLNLYYDNDWNRTKATLKHVYFNNLWRGTATVAAFTVVLLTLIQTILAVLDRTKPKK